MAGGRLRGEGPGVFAVIAVGAVLGGLLVGFEPVGGDPDRMYRPLKEELARSLRRGTLPFWSDAFGLGVPLVAESHVAAFYPPNWVFYTALGVPAAYRVLMALHLVALAALTYAYARSVGLTAWGAALAAVAFTLCGFQEVHATHEPFYTLMPYLPLALLVAGRYVETGRIVWVAVLALVLGVQLTIGHFQVQMWTGGLVLVTGFWRLAARRGPWRRAFGLVAGVAWGGAVAGVQLALSWDFARAVGHTDRPLRDMAFFSYPPAHWFEPALPWFFRGLMHGGEDPYWFSLGTTGYEAVFYVGTVPLLLAFVGALDIGRGRPGTWVWRIVVVVSLALATMPYWWIEGYALLLKLPGLGYFRAPARYTLLASLGLALLAGQGLDRAVASGRQRAGFGLAGAFAFGAFGFAFFWSARPGLRLLPGLGGFPFGVATAAVSWGLALASVSVWKSGKVGAWLPVGLTVVELAALFYLGPTQWGWAVRLPEQSPVLSALAADATVRRVGGVVDNLPVRAGRVTATPYLGMALTPINRQLRSLQERSPRHGPTAEHWQRRLGVTHSVWDEPASFGPEADAAATVVADPALDALVYRPVGKPVARGWRVVRHGAPFPEARAVVRARVAPDRASVLQELGRETDPGIVWFVAGDLPTGFLSGPVQRADSARVSAWDARAGVATVEHDGTCDLVFTRAFDPGWRASVNGGPEHPTLQADGGLMSVRLAGNGPSRVALRYAPGGLVPGAVISVAAVAGALVVIGRGRKRFTAAGAENGKRGRGE